MPQPVSPFLEALDDKSGTKWRIKVISAGLSRNNNYYPDAVLREAVPLFDGVRVFVKSDEEHLKGQGKSFNQLIGQLSNPKFIEGEAADTGYLQADLDVLQSAGDVPARLKEAYERGMTQLFGFSIDADGTASKNRGRRVARQLKKIHSVDLIIEPGAGGELIQLLEAVNPEEQDDMSLRERMIEAIKTAGNGKLPEGLDTQDDEALVAAWREAMQPGSSEPSNNDGVPGDGITASELEAKMKQLQAQTQAQLHLREAVAASALPEAGKQKVLQQFAHLESFTEAQVDQAIKTEAEYLANFTESGKVTGLGGAAVVEDRADKIKTMLDDFFEPGARKVNSFKECYVEITGDRLVTGHLENCDPVRMREALGGTQFREALDSSSFSNVLGNAMNRAMLKEYGNQSQFDIWKQLADIVPVNDFRTQERTRFGGYGDLPTVAENGAYTALTSPTDEKATYAVGKKGGTETVSLEMIKNDDVGAIRRIPGRMTRAAKRTLGKFVLDFIANNPLIYDGVALFAAGHNNLGTTALSASSLAAARLAMLKQTEAGSNEALSIPPVNLWVPFDLEETAVDLFRRNTENDTNFLQSLSLNVIPVWYWTDTNDWAISADVRDIPIIEIGFLDGNEEPELFVQDSPTNGSLFSNDQITYKIRHIYGGNVMDYRGLHKNVVV